jgi:hypothetical protein
LGELSLIEALAACSCDDLLKQFPGIFRH